MEEREIEKIYEKENMTEKEKEKLSKCLNKYCPLGLGKLGEKDCIECMYCYQILPNIVKVKGKLGSFEMQNERFGRYIRE